jgi:hypothetical protein
MSGRALGMPQHGGHSASRTVPPALSYGKTLSEVAVSRNAFRIPGVALNGSGSRIKGNCRNQEWKPKRWK